MKRFLYALRFGMHICVHPEQGSGQPNRPFSYYLHRYDRRQAIFRGERDD